MIIEKNVWILRPMPHGINRLNEFLKKGLIAIGYPAGVSFANKSYNDLKSLLVQEGWSEGIGNVNLFVKKMHVGDLVLVPDDNKRDVYIGEITSDYIYKLEVDKPNKEYYPHQRKVKWYFDKKPILRKHLPEEIRGSLRYPGTIANITKHREIIDHLIKPEDSNNVFGRIKPVKDEVYINAVNVLQDLLNDNDPEIRIKAAEVIVNHYSSHN
ncbi:hypothetical protein I0292_26535 (plasmid) [Priestia megaterium]|uniref:restriction endonuclease n=1 Tax=Priestia megaterium TaxID=1404 RepID=UPI002063AA1D|nr:hypothetical protein [Priestia megaterium]UOO43807.1 hypothetical protein I0292_26535 [Priestia megaterium]